MRDAACQNQIEIRPAGRCIQQSQRHVAAKDAGSAPVAPGAPDHLGDLAAVWLTYRNDWQIKQVGYREEQRRAGYTVTVRQLADNEAL
jgi:hypothetical protein